MANKIILKKSSVASKVPLATDLEIGEVAVNLADQKLYSKNASGTVIVVGNGIGGTGTVTSVGMTVPTGLTVSGTPVTSSGTLAVTLTSGYSIPTTASQTNWDSAYTQRLQWDGGSTNLVAATGRSSLGGTTVGQNLFTLTNPSAVTFPRINADNTISTLDAATFRSAIGAGTGNGTVTGVTATAPVASSGGTAPVISLNAAYGDTTNPYASKTANYFLAAPNGTAGAPTFRAIVAADIPTLNQNTTGSSGSCTGNAATATNADLLDGQHGSYYQPASTAITTSNIGSQSVNYATSAGSATNATNATNADTLDSHHGYEMSWGHDYAHGSWTDFNTFINTAYFGAHFVQGTTNGPGHSGAGQYYHQRMSLGSNYNNYSMQFAIPRNVSDAYLYYRNEEGGSAGSWYKIRAGYADSAGTAGSITGQANSATITASSGVNASQIVQRDANGYIYANYINHNTSETENPTINSIFVSNGDGWTRKASQSHFVSQLSLAQMSGSGCVLENNQTISSNYTMTSGKNGHSAGPITVATGVTVTIPTGSNWVIV